jgi:hypothetical protein
VDEKAEQELLDANKKRRKLTPSRKKLENPESASPRPVLRKDGVKQGRAPLSPAAERMRKSRARQSDKKKDKVKAKDTTARRETRQKRTAEEKAEDNHNRQKARGTRSSKAKREQKKRRRDAWAGRDPKKKEAHNAKRKKDREKRTPEQVEAENAKAKESMRGLTQARKGIVLDLAGSFETTKLWEVPGIDYVFDDFQDNPDSSTLLFYGDNGTWRDREPKMLIAWMRLFRKLISTMIDIGGDANTDCAKQKLGGLTKLCRESIEDEVTLLRVVYEHIKKDDWQSIFAFRDKEAIDNLEFAALDWLVTKGLDCGQECKALREKRQQERAPILDSWARSLIGMRLKVPGYWWGNWPRKHARTTYDCEVVDVDYQVREAEEEEEDDKRYFVIRDDGYGERYPIEYTNVREYARGVEQEGDKSYELPEKAPLRRMSEDREEYVQLCADTLKAVEAGSHENLVEESYKFISKRMVQILNSQRVTPEMQRELGQKFLDAQGRASSWSGATDFDEENFTSVDAPLLTCASCGFRAANDGREKDEKSLFQDKAVKLLHWAELDDEKRSEHLVRMGKPPLSLPVNDKGDEKDFETWRAYSRWPAEKPDELSEDATLPDWVFCKNIDGAPDRSKPKYFHLHPEFVQEFTDDHGRKDFKVKLCRNCCEFKPSEKTKTPMRSIARGVDFGSPSRVGLVRLTMRERQIISPVRHYECAVKIEPNDGKQRELSHSAIKGHSVLFDHDCPRVVKKLLSEESINGSIEIHFVGPDGQYDHLAKKALGSAQVSARPFAVYQWLSVLREVNAMYSDDDALPKFDARTRRMSPSFEEATELIDKCNKSLVENAINIATDEEIAKKADIARDDIREVRAASSRGEAALGVRGNDTSQNGDKVSPCSSGGEHRFPRVQ